MLRKIKPAEFNNMIRVPNITLIGELIRELQNPHNVIYLTDHNDKKIARMLFNEESNELYLTRIN